LGGFVAFPDDDPDCPYEKDDPNLLRNRPIKDRALVISAGVIANVIFAYSILLSQVSYSPPIPLPNGRGKDVKTYAVDVNTSRIDP
jgi:membrane-associated protease RseP (regulator of RpoE activity)